MSKIGDPSAPHAPGDTGQLSLLPRAVPQPAPDNMPSAQPGGGLCYRIEMAWGCWRRWYLKRFRPGYVRRMAEKRKGSCEGAPHEILDPRDLKFVANRVECRWDPADDPFQWREVLPFARWGLAELQIMGWPLLALTIATAVFLNWYYAIVPGLLLFFVGYFFRDPYRRIPVGEGILVSPADGKVVEVTRLERDDFIGGPAVRIGIFLSVFNVHVNRAPAAARVIALRYSPGAFLNALNPESSLRNENLWIGLEAQTPPHRKMIVRQVAGLIARKIVCPLRPGETLAAGQRIGMIKFGSRTELIVPDEPGLEIEVRPGMAVRGGSDILARYKTGGDSAKV